MKIIFIILVFGIIIFIHEFGHFIIAKLNKITVNEFSIGMGPAIVSFERKETKYSIRLLPIGGYCLMLGEEDDENEDENAFCNKSIWARLAVIFAGPMFNFILAFICSIVLSHFCGIDPAYVNVVKDGAAYEAGMRDGDRIVGIGNETVYNYREILVYMATHDPKEPIMLTYERDGVRTELEIHTKPDEENNYLIGVVGGYRESENFLQDVQYGALECRYWIKSTVMTLKLLVTGKVGKDSLMGPVGVGSVMSDTLDQAKENGGMVDVLLNVINFIVLLSTNLGVMNLLPIPALDGGRILFLLIELVSKKKVPKDKEAIVNLIGFVLLMILMIFVFFNDIINVFTGKLG